MTQEEYVIYLESICRLIAQESDATKREKMLLLLIESLQESVIELSDRCSISELVTAFTSQGFSMDSNFFQFGIQVNKFSQQNRSSVLQLWLASKITPTLLKKIRENELPPLLDSLLKTKITADLLSKFRKTMSDITVLVERHLDNSSIAEAWKIFQYCLPPLLTGTFSAFTRGSFNHSPEEAIPPKVPTDHGTIESIDLSEHTGINTNFAFLSRVSVFLIAANNPRPLLIISLPALINAIQRLMGSILIFKPRLTIEEIEYMAVIQLLHMLALPASKLRQDIRHAVTLAKQSLPPTSKTGPELVKTTTPQTAMALAAEVHDDKKRSGTTEELYTESLQVALDFVHAKVTTYIQKADQARRAAEEKTAAEEQAALESAAPLLHALLQICYASLDSRISLHQLLSAIRPYDTLYSLGMMVNMFQDDDYQQVLQLWSKNVSDSALQVRFTHIRTTLQSLTDSLSSVPEIQAAHQKLQSFILPHEAETCCIRFMASAAFNDVVDSEGRPFPNNPHDKKQFNSAAKLMGTIITTKHAFVIVGSEIFFLTQGLASATLLSNDENVAKRICEKYQVSVQSLQSISPEERAWIEAECREHPAVAPTVAETVTPVKDAPTAEGTMAAEMVADTISEDTTQATPPVPGSLTSAVGSFRAPRHDGTEVPVVASETATPASPS